ncbi:MAG: VCBS repeat-containing protein [Candidatus Omnitrophica bacterium]|nr:VCBS repeat-containing protein [Candidatus Omnitrophota bacterium]
MTLRVSLNLFLLSIFVMTPSHSLESGKKIPVGTETGRGPLATYGVVTEPMGCARISGATDCDLFLRTTRFGEETGLFLYPFQNRTEEGTPIFGEGARISHPFGDASPPSGTLLQLEDGTVHGLWLQGSEVVHTIFSAEDRSLREIGRAQVEGLPRNPRNLAALPMADGAWRVAFDVSDGVRYRPPDDVGSRDPEYNPYDGRGIWRGKLSAAGLFAAPLSADFSKSLKPASLISQTTQEVLDSYCHLDAGRFARNADPVVIGGGRMGEMMVYSGIHQPNQGSIPGRYVVDRKGNILRHPTIQSSPVFYPNPETGLSDLIVGGEGGAHYYRFTGEFTDGGSPVFEDPVPALQAEADLYAGSLPVPNAVDWDGDGDLDIVSGNSEGFVLFFENIGSNADPKYASGKRLSAGGRTIHLQPGYRLDIQGPFESRWGYVCPTVADWNEDGRPDLLLSDSTARHRIALNVGTATEPELEPLHPIYLKGLELHGTWRVKPGVAKLGGRMAYVALDDDDQFHLYWRLDDYNLEEGGKLRLEDGSPIGANFLSAGGTGRLKINLCDWDLDGKVDLVVGTPKHGSVPNPETGLPQSLGLPGSAVLFLRNVGTNEAPRFKFPVIFRFKGKNLYIGHHSCGPTVAEFDPKTGPDLIVANEDGRFFFFERKDLEWE